MDTPVVILPPSFCARHPKTWHDPINDISDRIQVLDMIIHNVAKANDNNESVELYLFTATIESIMYTESRTKEEYKNLTSLERRFKITAYNTTAPYNPNVTPNSTLLQDPDLFIKVLHAGACRHPGACFLGDQCREFFKIYEHHSHHSDFICGEPNCNKELCKDIQSFRTKTAGHQKTPLFIHTSRCIQASCFFPERENELSIINNVWSNFYQAIVYCLFDGNKQKAKQLLPLLFTRRLPFNMKPYTDMIDNVNPDGKYNGKLYDHNECVICYAAMDNFCVFEDCGHTVCPDCIKKCIKKECICPVCKETSLFVFEIDPKLGNKIVYLYGF